MEFMENAFSAIESLWNVYALRIIGNLFSSIEAYSWIGESTHFVNLDFIDSQLSPVATSLGLQLSLLKYTLSLFLAYPFAALLRVIPSHNLKHLISCLGGIFLVQWVFGPDWIHSFISSAVTYLLCLLVPRKYQHLAVFFWAMGYMTLSHGYRMYVSYMSGIFDFTGTQMVLTMKLTSFAYNLYDGTYDKQRVFATYDDEKDKKKRKIYGDRKRFAIQSLPNPLEFFGYIYCFTCILAGPAFEYVDYVDSINGKKFKDPKANKNAKIPSSILPALWRLVVGVVFMGLHLYLTGLFPLSNIYNPVFIASYGYLYRFGYTWLALTGDRVKYYFAWKVAEGASIMGGFGFEGFDKEGHAIGWKAVENVDIIGFETAYNIQVLSRSWNKRTQGWLERYTYQRTNSSLVATYFISALWHGLYPGFFLFFMSVPILTAIERLTKERINPIVIPGYDGYNLVTAPKGIIAFLYWQFCRIGTLAGATYIVQVFGLLSWERSMAAYGSYRHIPHLAFFVIYFVLTLIPKQKSSKKKTS